MNKLALLLAGLTFCVSSLAEEPVKNFYFAGYKAIFIPSDTFRVEVGNPELGIQEIKEIGHSRNKRRNDVVHT